MGSDIWSRRNVFHMITTTLLSLLLPLSFLLLSRLSTANYLLSVSSDYPPSPHPTLCSSFFLHPKTATILHVLVSLIGLSTLAHALTGGKTTVPPRRGPRLCAAWIFLCSLQTFVGFGIEGSIAAGVEGSGFGQENSCLCRVVFFFGLHETTMFWWRAVVKPVADDTVLGGWRKEEEEGWWEKAAIGAGYGCLWWWRLREEVESLVVVPEVRNELMMGIGAADFMGWWLYYLTVAIGMVRLVKGVVCAVRILTRRTGEGDIRSHDEKVRVGPSNC